MSLFFGTQFFFAYVDGGSASIIFQAVIGGVLAAGYLFSTKFHYFKSKLTGMLRRANNSES